MTYYRFPREHHRQIRTNNMLAAARLRYVSGGRWGTRRYMDMNRLKELQEAESPTADKKIA